MKESYDYQCTHLDIFEDKSVLYESGKVVEFAEGAQSAEAKKRYEIIRKAFHDGFLPAFLEHIQENGIADELDEKDILLLDTLANGITGNCGRAIVAVAITQLSIKIICPDQSIRLHKSSSQRNAFSWCEGVSMRNLDKDYVTPFLRESGLLKLNADGAMMTRTLAENYPYSKMYKAQLQGPRQEWLDLVTRLENGNIEPKPALEYFLSLLLNKSDKFNKSCDEALTILSKANNITIEKTEKALITFINETNYPARAFEIVLHAFMQALKDLNYIYETLEPLSQMRSANKKHGNIGDIELKDDKDIIEAWDAKFGKTYLWDELDELTDKLENSSKVALAGFVTNTEPDIRNDIEEKISEIALLYDTEIQILSFQNWVKRQCSINPIEDKDKLAHAWLKALVETFAQRRVEIAPIDEPCDQWIRDISKIIRRYFK